MVRAVRRVHLIPGIVLALLAATLTGMQPAAAAVPSSCTWSDNGNGFDISWDQTEPDKVIVRRTVDGAGPYWRAAVDSPATSFVDGAAPAGAVVAYEIAHKVGNTVGAAIPCTEAGAGGTDAICVATPQRNGGVTIAWFDFPAGDAEIRRTDNGNNLVHTETGDGFEYFHSTAPAAATYEVTAAGTTVACDAEPEGLGTLTRADLGIPELNASGIPAIGPSVTPPAPQRVAYTPITEPTTLDPAQAIDICDAQLMLPINSSTQGQRTYARITIPNGLTFRVDGVMTKLVTDDGNWGSPYGIRYVNPDGTVGNKPWQADDGTMLPDYSSGWDDRVQTTSKTLWTNNTGVDQDVYVFIGLSVRNGISDNDGAMSFISNPRFLDSNGDLVSQPCGLDPAACFQAGAAEGNRFYSYVEFTVDGVTYDPGCYDWYTCVADLPSILGAAQEFACNYQTELTFGLGGVAVVALVVAGGVVLLPLGPSVPNGAVTVSFLESGFVSTKGATGILAGVGFWKLFSGTTAGVASALTTGGVWVLEGIDNEIPVISLEPQVTNGPGPLSDAAQDAIDALGTPEGEWEIEPETGIVTVITPGVWDDLYDRIDLVEPPAHVEPEAREAMGRAAAVAVAECVANVTDSMLTTFWANLPAGSPWTPHPDSDGVAVDANTSEERHACELIPIYINGAVAPSGSSQIAATAHIRETLTGVPATVGTTEGIATSWPAYPLWTAQQPGTAQANLGDLAKILTYNSTRGSDSWRTTVSCVGQATNTACDEWPWARTDQGGNPNTAGWQPPGSHLRIINFSQNSVSGRDYREFLKECSVNDDESLFIAAVVPNDLLLNVATDPASGEILTPNVYVC